MKKYIIFLFSLFLFLPAISLADTLGCSLGTSNVMLGDVFSYATCVISTSIIPLLLSLAVMLFVWGVVMYVINPSEEEKKKKGKSFMIWGIIALAVIVSVWGLVSILRTTFGIDNAIPQVQTS
jgi:uncharacterized membrane protein YidH (DUF202 family)